LLSRTCGLFALVLSASIKQYAAQRKKLHDIDIRDGEHQAVDAKRKNRSFLGKEAGVDALLLSSGSISSITGPTIVTARRQEPFHRSAVLVFRISWCELEDLPPTDPVVVDLPPQTVAHDDPNLPCLGEHGIRRRRILGIRHRDSPSTFPLALSGQFSITGQCAH
jgi:hypothetical protein